MTRILALANGYVFRQLFDNVSCTYTYLIGDLATKEAVLIDPVFELAERDVKIVQELGLNLTYALNTHVHADHITGTGKIKSLVPECKSVISKVSKAVADVHLDNNDTISVGSQVLTAVSTPGHTNGCLSYIWHLQKAVFTGDAVLIRGCGRTDFQEGSSKKLYESVHKNIFTLPDDYLIFPAHDYKGFTCSSVGEEKQYNPRLTKTLDEFIKIMDELNLPYPKLIDAAVPANLKCGLFEVSSASK